MILRSHSLLVLVGLVALNAFGADLLNVAEGQLANDTGTSQTTQQIVRMNGQSWLQVDFAAGDSIGQNPPAIRDWQPFRQLRIPIVNSGKPATLNLVIRHAGSRDYRSRVDYPLSVPSGHSLGSVLLRELRNNGGDLPDLSRVNHWYIHNPGSARRFRFGSLEFDAAPPQALAESAELPAITAPIHGHTKAADAILSKLQVFPETDPWNQDIRAWPLHPNSAKLVASVGADKPLRYNPDMAFVIVPSNQPKVPVRVVGYPGESDPGPYPVPPNVPIEGWPGQGKPPDLSSLQRDLARQGGDRHAIVLDPINGKLYEFFQMQQTLHGWQATQASIFDLRSNQPRPVGWTSADAAGLPIFPAVVRYDEIERGVIDHALRVTIRKSRRAYVAPASHYASRHNDPDLPRMGERFRLRSDFDTRGFSRPVRIILNALKTHGMLVADNGIEWAVSVAPDPRIPILHEELRRVRGRDFEVVVAP
jgi:hypothetical protein